jgi:hypothetical protein
MMTENALAPAPSPAPAPAPSSAPAPADWTAALAPEHKTLVTERQWKSPDDLVKSYRNLESLRGVPADRLLTLPADDKPESWAPIYDRLGRPKTADEYQLPLPEGDNGEFAKIAAGWFHEQGIPKKAAQAITAKWNDFAKQSVEKQTAERVAKVEASQAALKAEWKTDYDKNMAVAQQAAQKLGFTKEIVDSLEDKLGYDGVMKFVHSLGAKLGEHGFHSAGGASGATGLGTSVEAAKAEIQTLRSDGDFQRRFAEGEAAAVAKWRALHKQAFPDQAA